MNHGSCYFSKDTVSCDKIVQFHNKFQIKKRAFLRYINFASLYAVSSITSHYGAQFFFGRWECHFSSFLNEDWQLRRFFSASFILILCFADCHPRRLFCNLIYLTSLALVLPLRCAHTVDRSCKSGRSGDNEKHTSLSTHVQQQKRQEKRNTKLA